MTRFSLAAAFLCAAFAIPTASAQNDYFYPEGTTLNASIPSPEAFLGYPIGAFHTRHDRIVAYLQELARLSDRASYQSIGLTYEHRPMPVLTVTSPENHGQLDAIRQRHLSAIDPLRDPEPATTEQTARRPVIVHLGYGVHGNETSSAEAAMLTAYWLVAATGPDSEKILSQGVFHVEPVLNPDGRDRHTQWANSNRAQPFVADALDREHNEVWPGGRTNHYWFDLNRDWLPLVNPESKARIDFHHAWRPEVVTDYHEMGANSSYFFEPSEPYGSWNPLIPEELYTDITIRFADRWANALDDLGSMYFTKEQFDNTYPGYGSTYPNFLGGLGLVFEQASARGHIQESTHHGVLTFPFAIRNHLRTSLATITGAVAERDRLHKYQRDFFESALVEAENYGTNGWVFGDPQDPSLNRAFLDLLLRHRIEVYQLSRSTEGFEPESGWVVPARQPLYRLARSIFERTDVFADSVFYDASAWTVSLAYGIPDAELKMPDLPLGDRVTAVPVFPGHEVALASVAYLMDWRDSGAMPALQALQAAGIRAEAAFKPFVANTTSGDVHFGRGSVSIPVQTQTMTPERLHQVVADVSRNSDVAIFATQTGLSTSGPDLGSGNFRPIRSPRVLLPVGERVSSYEAGQLWHLLDQRLNMPVTKVDVSDLGRVDWAEYNILVLVPGAERWFTDSRLDALKAWIRGGGTLIAQRGAAAWAARSELTAHIQPPGLGKPVERGKDKDQEEIAAPPERRDYADAGEISGAQAIGGSIWEADLDLTHPLGFGYTRRFLPIWRDHDYFFDPSNNPYSTVAQIVRGDARLSGYISDANSARLEGSPSVMADRLGSGAVILLVDNPNFRGYWRGTSRLFVNALFFGDHIRVPTAPR